MNYQNWYILFNFGTKIFGKNHIKTSNVHNALYKKANEDSC